MRNLKKFLALVLAMVMAFSLMLTANAAVGDYDKYADKDQITEEFQTAVEVLTGLDVLKGDENGFRPASTLTRAEAAVIVYRVATGDVKDNQTALYADYNHFADVKSNDWFAGYVGYCQNAGIIKGTSPTTFSPYQKVSGYQLLAMLLRVIGYGKNNEFTGSAWQVNTAALAEQLHLTDTVKDANFSSTLNMDARRDVVAELTFRTLIGPSTVTYTPALGYSENSSLLGTTKNQTQGRKIFRLFEQPELKADKWGVPYDSWYTFKLDNSHNEIAKIEWDPVAEYTVAKTECDIIHENTKWSDDKDKTVTSHWLNGFEAFYTVNDNEYLTEGDDNIIEALGTTKVVGAQGRWTRIYDMSKSYLNGKEVTFKDNGARIVEIDTFLARVDKVTPAGTDKNGHPTPDTIDLSVYPGDGIDDIRRHDTTLSGSAHNVTANQHIAWDFDGVEAKDFTVGQYVLVYVNWAKNGDKDPSIHALQNKADAISDIKAAEIKNGGYVNLWTNGKLDQPHTTTVGNTAYNDSDKFCLNWRQNNRPYSVAMDRYGNAIGLVNPTQYLAIEAVRWIHDGTLYGGYALADVILADGTKVEGIHIADVNNRITTNTSDDFGQVQASTVSDYFTNNRQYYKHIYNYAVKEDGTYSLRAELCGHFNVVGNVYDRPWGNDPKGDATIADCAHYGIYNAGNEQIHEVENARIAQGEATIWGEVLGATNVLTTNTYVATSNTVFAVLDSNNLTYTVYTGKENVPSFNNATLCVVLDAQGYAEFVLIKDYNLTNNQFVAYLPDLDPVDTKYAVNGQLVYGYNVYKVGETAPSKVYYTSNTMTAGAFARAQTGFYEFTVNNDGVLIALTNKFSSAPVPANGSTACDTDLLHNGAEAVPTDLDGNFLTRTRVEAAVKGTSIETNNYYNALALLTNKFAPVTTANATNSEVANGYAWLDKTNSTPTAKTDFNVASAKVMVIEKEQNAGVISLTDSRVYEGSMADVNNDSVVWVYYKDRTVNGLTVHDAAMIYVLKVPFDTGDHDKTASVTFDSISFQSGAVSKPYTTVANGLIGYYATAWGENSDALTAARTTTTKVKLQTIKDLVGTEGGDFQVILTPTYTAGVFGHEGDIPGKVVAPTFTKLFVESGDTKLPAADVAGKTVDLAASVTAINNYAVSVGDRFLMVNQYGPDAGANTYYVYTVIEIVE